MDAVRLGGGGSRRVALLFTDVSARKWAEAALRAARIVEQHGGSITAESEEGRGATFTVRLPLAPPHQPGSGPPKA